MASRQSKLEAERLSIIQKSMSRGRSNSPSRTSHPNSRSPSMSNGGDMNNDLKWSVVNHDPLERLGDNEDQNNDEMSGEEHISDDDNNEKFQYDDTGNILPNYACRDEKINEISNILEHSNLNDTKTLDDLTAKEKSMDNAKDNGDAVNEGFLTKVKDAKAQLEEGVLGLTKNDQDVLNRKDKLENYSTYRKKIVQQENEKQEKKNHRRDNNTNTDRAGSPQGDNFMIPYTSAIEDKIDSEFASQLNETILEDEVDSNKPHSRVIQTITRGNFFQLIDPKIKPKMFLLCMDFSPESIFALEWSLGTVLVDGSVLFIICVIEENDSNHHLKVNTSNESSREQQRLKMLNKAKQQVLNLLKLTKLQIHVVIEIVHHPIPRHLILELIDNLQPTLVIVGSKGQSAIKGVLLGSLSNYLVTKLSVPVMVVREKLKKINRFKNGSSVFSNNIKPLTLSEARVD